MMWFLYFGVFTSYILVIVIYIPFALEYAFLSILAAFVKLWYATVKNSTISLFKRFFLFIVQFETNCTLLKYSVHALASELQN